VVDDDRDIRVTVAEMLAEAHIAAHPFASGADFLAALGDLAPGCILLDIRMPEMDGIEVMSQLAGRDVDWPVIAITGDGDIPLAVSAMKLGAVEFLQKPFLAEALITCFENAFPILEQRLKSGARRRHAEKRVQALTARERDVLQGLLAGLSNKQIAEWLAISLRTVEMHRANMMDRLRVENLAEALTLAMDAMVEPAQLGEWPEARDTRRSA
jgi:two-component system response regulator FixJ